MARGLLITSNEKAMRHRNHKFDKARRNSSSAGFEDSVNPSGNPGTFARPGFPNYDSN